jgi:hypothetical protein
MSIKSRVILVFALILLAACSLIEGDQGGSQPTAPPPSDPTALALAAAQARLEEHLGRELEGIQVAYGPGEWTDTSLGCPQDGIVAEERSVAGYTFEMTVDGTMYELHTDGDGSVVVLCPKKEVTPKVLDLEIPAEVEKPLENAKSLLAESLGVAPDSVDPDEIAWELTTFPNSGLGCPDPEMVYAEVLTEGYAFTLSFQDQVYEIHTDLAGESAVLCLDEETAVAGPSADTVSTELPETVKTPFVAARAVLAEALDIPTDSLTLDSISWEETTFASTALGCPEEGMVYSAVEVDGYAFSLTHSGTEYQIHTDLSGAIAVFCPEGERAVARDLPSADELPRIVFTSYGDESLGFGISYPLGWIIERADGEVLFQPAGNDPTLGMTVSRQETANTDIEALMSQYQITLYNNDATAIEIEGPHPIGPGGRSQVFSREVAGIAIFERVTFFAQGYRVLQWGPMAERTTWSDPFIQMLNSFIVLGGEQ